jgi:hypothetical protein
VSSTGGGTLSTVSSTGGGTLITVRGGGTLCTLLLQLLLQLLPQVPKGTFPVLEVCMATLLTPSIQLLDQRYPLRLRKTALQSVSIPDGVELFGVETEVLLTDQEQGVLRYLTTQHDRQQAVFPSIMDCLRRLYSLM